MNVGHLAIIKMALENQRTLLTEMLTEVRQQQQQQQLALTAQLAQRFAGFYNDANVLIAYSAEDEYVPASVDKTRLLQRLATAMKSGGAAENVDGSAAGARFRRLCHSHHCRALLQRAQRRQHSVV